MGKKRKRPVKDGRTRPGLSQTSSTTAPETAVGSRNNTNNNDPVSLSRDSSRHLSHPVLSLYYNHLVPLRQYLLRQIPVSSRSRRRRIASIGRGGSTQIPTGGSPLGSNGYDNSGPGLASFLDTTLVGVLRETPPTTSKERQRDLIAFTQSQSRSQISSTDSGPSCAQAEVM